MGLAVQQDDDFTGSDRDDLLEGLRRTRVYREASPSEQADLESFLNDLRSGGLAPSSDPQQRTITDEN